MVKYFRCLCWNVKVDGGEAGGDKGEVVGGSNRSGSGVVWRKSVV